MDTKDYCRSGT